MTATMENRFKEEIEAAANGAAGTGVKVVEIDWSNADQAKALAACRALCRAYDNGEDNDGSIE
jgi:hypothetical protein